MSHLSYRLVAAVALLCASQASVAGEKPQAGFDAQAASALNGLPVEVVVLNEHLRAQIAYQYVSVDAGYTQYSQMPGLTMGQSVGAGVAGGVIASLIINASMKADAEHNVQPASDTLIAGQCNLSDNDNLLRAIDDGIRSTAWGATAAINHHVLTGKQGLDDAVPDVAPRYVFGVSYSLSPDFSAVETTVNATAYSAALPGAPKHWQKDPAWFDQLVVVSNRLTIAPKSAEDSARAIAAENARYAQTNAQELITEALAGDFGARNKAAVLARQHDSFMREAKETKWSPRTEAARRSELWSENQCARLKSALQANNDDLKRMLARLFAGQMPAVAAAPETRTAPAAMVVAANTDAAPAAVAVTATTDATTDAGSDATTPPEAATEDARDVFAAPGNLYVLRRAVDIVPLEFRYSWLPEPKGKKS